MLTPNIHLTDEASVKEEIQRLARVIGQVVMRQELAWFRGNDGKIRRGVNCTSFPKIHVSFCPTANLSGWIALEDIRINVTPTTSWATVVYTLVHEFCHWMRPWHELPRHSRSFWSLLNTSLHACYGTGVPLGPFKKGTGQNWWRNDRACEELEAKYEWAKVMPRQQLVGSNL